MGNHTKLLTADLNWSRCVPRYTTVSRWSGEDDNSGPL